MLTRAMAMAPRRVSTATTFRLPRSRAGSCGDVYAPRTHPELPDARDADPRESVGGRAEGHALPRRTGEAGMIQKFTAEEVRANIAANRRYMTTETELQLTAYAERIEADERAVPMAWMTHHDEPMLFLVTEEAAAYCDDDEMPIPLFVHPPAQAAQAAQVDDSDALAHFTEYFVRNYPGPNTIISNPNWHAPKIFRAAQYAIASATKPAAPTADTLSKPADSGMEAEREFFARDFYEEAREGKKAWHGQCDSGRVDERLHSDSAEDVAQWLYANGYHDAAATVRNQIDARNARIRELESALTAQEQKQPASPAGVPDGYVLMPREPTRVMLEAM